MGKRSIEKAQSYIRRGNRRRVKSMLRKHPKLKESEEAMILFAAIWFRRDMVKWLLDQGVPPDTACGSGGNTPLMQASADGDVQLMEWLLAYGADPNRLNGESENALGFAVTYEQPEAVRRLVAAGANVNDTADSGPDRTQLDIAEQSGWPLVAAALRESGGVRYADLPDTSSIS